MGAYCLAVICTCLARCEATRLTRVPIAGVDSRPTWRDRAAERVTRVGPPRTCAASDTMPSGARSDAVPVLELRAQLAVITCTSFRVTQHAIRLVQFDDPRPSIRARVEVRVIAPREGAIHDVHQIGISRTVQHQNLVIGSARLRVHPAASVRPSPPLWYVPERACHPGHIVPVSQTPDDGTNSKDTGCRRTGRGCRPSGSRSGRRGCPRSGTPTTPWVAVSVRAAQASSPRQARAGSLPTTGSHHGYLLAGSVVAIHETSARTATVDLRLGTRAAPSMVRSAGK